MSKKERLEWLEKEVKKIQNEIDFGIYHNTYPFGKLLVYSRSLKEVIESLTSRLAEQEKLTSMILSHLGLEYAKLTEETKDGKRKKEVLRKIKKKT